MTARKIKLLTLEHDYGKKTGSSGRRNSSKGERAQSLIPSQEAGVTAEC